MGDAVAGGHARTQIGRGSPSDARLRPGVVGQTINMRLHRSVGLTGRARYGQHRQLHVRQINGRQLEFQQRHAPVRCIGRIVADHQIRFRAIVVGPVDAVFDGGVFRGGEGEGRHARRTKLLRFGRQGCQPHAVRWLDEGRHPPAQYPCIMRHGAVMGFADFLDQHAVVVGQVQSRDVQGQRSCRGRMVRRENVIVAGLRIVTGQQREMIEVRRSDKVLAQPARGKAFVEQPPHFTRPGNAADVVGRRVVVHIMQAVLTHRINVIRAALSLAEFECV
ncbi:MAG: hypothetical protein BWX84_03197 [Verrucomicrobia bacterium ADurb.Bin118]|nr:MAG: hypothetical protein BWX84_03197 [Verrucomicrobia bacterium ADurb.Bin118]